ncbi:MAG TPA: LapA family protein [Thermoplasmatales archaeon]|nr:LapA family protein [Thermoplasmatales archaeon]
MIRTVIYLILFILAIIFLFQNGSQPVTLTFLKWSTPEPIPVGFVFIGALLFGAIVVWLWHLPQIILLKRKTRSLNKRITKLVEDIKRKENELEALKKEKEELEAKLREIEGKKPEETEEKSEREKEEKVVEQNENDEKNEKKRGFFGFLKGRKGEEGGN